MISTLTLQIIIRYTSSHILSVTHLTVSAETTGHVIFPHEPTHPPTPTPRDHVLTGIEKEVISLVSVISRPTNDHRQISSSPTKIDWMG